MQLIHNMPYPGLREADRDIIKERKIRNMRRNLYDGGLTVNGDKKLAVFGIAAACAIGLINHMQYRNLAKRMEDLEVTVEMELFRTVSGSCVSQDPYAESPGGRRT